MTKYPLCEKAGLEVRSTFAGPEPWAIEARDVERLLANAPQVSGVYQSNAAGEMELHPRSRNYEWATHTDRLLLIEELKPDTVESLLREILFERYQDTLIGPKEWGEFQERARKVLGGEK